MSKRYHSLLLQKTGHKITLEVPGVVGEEVGFPMAEETVRNSGVGRTFRVPRVGGKVRVSVEQEKQWGGDAVPLLFPWSHFITKKTDYILFVLLNSDGSNKIAQIRLLLILHVRSLQSSVGVGW